MMKRSLVTGLLAVLVCGCSGGSDAPAKETMKPAEPAPLTPDEAERQDKLRKLRAAQDSAVEAMCERLVDCSVESLKTAPPDERAKAGNVDELIPRARTECEAQGAKSELSPRQVVVIQKCVNESATCEALVACLDEAGKSAADSPAGSR